MEYKDDTAKQSMLRWERLNAAEYLRKDKITQQENLDSRVINVVDRYACVCVCDMGIISSCVFYIYCSFTAEFILNWYHITESSLL